MKTFRIILALLLFAVPTLHAQIVNDGATNTLSNVTNTFTGDVTVGTNGSFTLLVLSDNALLTNSANGLIGRNNTANSNEVRLVSPSARWFMGGALIVGTNGAANRLVVSNGATVLAGSSSTLGHGGGFGGNANSNSATVSGPGSLWSSRLDLIVGELGSANRLDVNSSGWVVNSNAFVGRSIFSPSNTVLVTGSGSLWSNRADLSLGGSGSGNLLVVSNGGWVVNSNASVGASSLGNLALVTGTNSTWSNRADLYVGNGARENQLVVSDGALVVDNNGVLGKTVTSSNNFALVTGGGSIWNNRLDLDIGRSGRDNQLIVSNGGWVANRYGYLGRQPGSSNNFTLVTGSGSVWSNQFDMYVGFNERSNRLVIEAGGLAHCDNGYVGDFGSASNNEALVTGPGSLWTNRSFLTIGSQAGRNRLVVSNGATVWSGTGSVGGSSAVSNQVIVTGAGSVWSNETFLYLGAGSVGSRVDVSEGGWLACNDGYIGSGFGANSNTVTLTGGGSGWNNLGGLVVGEAGNGNVLIASNGATVLSSNATIGVNGSTANNNLAVITGAGTLWSNRNDLVVGSFGVGNRLQVDNGATLLSGNLFLGFNSLSANNRVTVDGTLRVTNAAGTGVLDVRRGTNVLVAGLVEVDRLLVTNTAGRFELNGGTVSTKNSSVNNGQPFRVGNGVSPATLFLAGDGSHFFGGGLTIAANAALTGSGTFSSSVSVLPGGALSPGASIGVMRFSSPPSLQGAIFMEVSKTGAALTNDQIQVASLLTYGGALTVTKIGPTALAAGDRFPLFAGAFNGSFATITLPALDPGLRWLTNLSVDGSIEVESLAPSVQTLPASALTQTNATLNGVADPKGTSASGWFEWGFSTNYGFATPPLALGSGNGNTNFSAAIGGLIPGVSYHFRAVASNSFGVAFGTNQSFPRFAQHAYLKASNAGAGDKFGYAIAVSGDTLVVGAPLEDSNATGVNGNQTNNSAGNSGAAYVFVRNGDFWVQQAYLKASNTEALDQFGGSVAIAGDTIVVGAMNEHSDATGVNGNQNNNGANYSGAAYVFVRSGTNWTQQAYLKASNTQQNDGFGASVAIAGDTVVVGAVGEDSNATGVNGDQTNNDLQSPGAAYVFVRNGTIWTQQAYLKASNTQEFDEFGASVAIAGDTVVVGAYAFGAGAYVFFRNGTTWTQQAHLSGINGSSVAISANTVVAGSGFVYVFVRNGTTWTPQGASFLGWSVAISANTMVLGVPYEASNATGVNGDQNNNGAPDSGAAHLYVRDGAAWSFREYFKASNTGSNDLFGSSVAMAGNLVAVGAPLENSSATGVNGDQNNDNAAQSGAVYVFGVPPPPVAEIGVSQSGTNISNGGTSQYFVVGTNTQSRVFTINNTGNGELTGLAITIGGSDAALFSVITTPVAPVAPTSNTTFTVRFAPISTGTNTATLHIASNDEDENPFDIQLSGLSLSFTEDRDGDGLNDASELLLSSLGFNFQVSQTSLVNTLFNNVGGAVSNLNAIGFFTQSQLQALNVNSPLLARDAFTGLFTLTIGVEKSTDLINFFPFPMTTPQTTINAEGKLEFQFSSPDGAAFFRLEAQ